MDKIKEIWYSKVEEEIDKYKYLLMLDLPREELEKLRKRDEIVESYAKKVNRLNDEFKYTRRHTVEEEEKYLANTRETLAYEAGESDGAKKSLMETAKSLLNMGIATIEQISMATGLSIEEIKKLKD